MGGRLRQLLGVWLSHGAEGSAIHRDEEVRGSRLMAGEEKQEFYLGSEDTELPGGPPREFTITNGANV